MKATELRGTLKGIQFLFLASKVPSTGPQFVPLLPSFVCAGLEVWALIWHMVHGGCVKIPDSGFMLRATLWTVECRGRHLFEVYLQRGGSGGSGLRAATWAKPGPSCGYLFKFTVHLVLQT